MRKKKKDIPPAWNYSLLAKLKEVDEEAYYYLWNNGAGRPELSNWKPYAATINEMFVWSSSPQGDNFWHDLYNKIGVVLPPWEL